MSHRFALAIPVLCVLVAHASAQNDRTSPEDSAFLTEVRANLSRAEQISHLYSYKAVSYTHLTLPTIYSV